jgi:hypothetical protein
VSSTQITNNRQKTNQKSKYSAEERKKEEQKHSMVESNQ